MQLAQQKNGIPARGIWKSLSSRQHEVQQVQGAACEVPDMSKNWEKNSFKGVLKRRILDLDFLMGEKQDMSQPFLQSRKLAASWA